MIRSTPPLSTSMHEKRLLLRDDSSTRCLLVVVLLLLLFFLVVVPGQAQNRPKTVEQRSNWNGIQGDTDDAQEHTYKPSRPSKINNTPFPTQKDSHAKQGVWHVGEDFLLAHSGIKLVAVRCRPKIKAARSSWIAGMCRNGVVARPPVGVVFLKDEKQCATTNPDNQRHQASRFEHVFGSTKDIVEFAECHHKVLELENTEDSKDAENSGIVTSCVEKTTRNQTLLHKPGRG